MSSMYIIRITISIVILVGSNLCFGLSEQPKQKHSKLDSAEYKKKSNNKKKKLSKNKKNNKAEQFSDVTIDLAEYEKAAVSGDLLAKYSLGIFYLKGFEVKQDYQKAVYWFGAAAKEDHVGAKLKCPV
jgi:TPR repeat protein